MPGTSYDVPIRIKQEHHNYDDMDNMYVKCWNFIFILVLLNYKNLFYWFSAQDDMYNPSNSLIPDTINRQVIQNNYYVWNNMYVNIEI